MESISNMDPVLRDSVHDYSQQEYRGAEYTNETIENPISREGGNRNVDVMHTIPTSHVPDSQDQSRTLEFKTQDYQKFEEPVVIKLNDIMQSAYTQVPPINLQANKSQVVQRISSDDDRHSNEKKLSIPTDRG